MIHTFEVICMMYNVFKRSFRHLGFRGKFCGGKSVIDVFNENFKLFAF